MKHELIWPPPSHVDRWSANLSVTLHIPGRREQEVCLTNFSASAVRITGANGMIDGGRAWLKVADHPPLAVHVIWVSETTAGCRFIRRLDADVHRLLLEAATGVDRTAIAAPIATEPAKGAYNLLQP
jgi:hypothetical protein